MIEVNLHGLVRYGIFIGSIYSVITNVTRKLNVEVVITRFRYRSVKDSRILIF